MNAIHMIFDSLGRINHAMIILGKITSTETKKQTLLCCVVERGRPEALMLMPWVTKFQDKTLSQTRHIAAGKILTNSFTFLGHNVKNLHFWLFG